MSSRKGKPSLRELIYATLQSKAAYGRSKHDDKQNGISDRYIYSYSTMSSYLKGCNSFGEWVRHSPVVRSDLGHRPRTLEEVRPYVQAYIDARAKTCAAPTVKLEASALQKLYGGTLRLEVPQARRADITRSRDQAVRDSHFSEARNADLVNLCRCCGPRRFELEKMRAQDLRQLADGSPAVRIIGKGGRPRTAPLVGSREEVAAAVEYIKTLTGHNHVSSAMDVHAYRAEYATRCYLSQAQNVAVLRGQKVDTTLLTGKTGKGGAHIIKGAVYACRGDMAGHAYDRAALIFASQCLGHNRESVVAEHYLRLDD